MVVWLGAPSAHEAPFVALMIKGIQLASGEPMGAQHIAAPLEAENAQKTILRTCQNYPESKKGQYRFKKYLKSVTRFPHGKRRRKCSKSAKNDTDNIRKSSQMANGVRVGHPAAPLGQVFVPRVARLKQTRRSQARL